jgi:hypothetical protein
LTRSVRGRPLAGRPEPGGTTVPTPDPGRVQVPRCRGPRAVHGVTWTSGELVEAASLSPCREGVCTTATRRRSVLAGPRAVAARDPRRRVHVVVRRGAGECRAGRGRRGPRPVHRGISARWSLDGTMLTFSKIEGFEGHAADCKSTAAWERPVSDSSPGCHPVATPRSLPVVHRVRLEDQRDGHSAPLRGSIWRVRVAPPNNPPPSILYRRLDRAPNARPRTFGHGTCDELPVECTDSASWGPPATAVPNAEYVRFACCLLQAACRGGATLERH